MKIGLGAKIKEMKMVQCHQIKAQFTAVLCRQFSRKREASKWGWGTQLAATVSSIMGVSLLERNIMSYFLSFNLQAERITPPRV